jgi:hypothetical protein
LPASVSSTATRVRRRRRPSGEPPPLPRQLQTSGKRWLLLIGVVVVAGVAIGTVRPAAVAADVVDHAVLSAFERIRTPWLTQAARAAGVLATSLGLLAVWWATLAVLLVWRWRHLQHAGPGRTAAGAGQARRRRAARRHRGLPVLPGAGGPFDVLFAVVVGVAIPLAAFRLFVPNEAFPVSYRRGRTAHLDITGARHDAIAHALEEQLGVVPVAIRPFNLAGSGGSTPLRITVKATSRPTCSPSCTRPPTCARTAGTSSVARCSTASWRTRRHSTPCAGWCSTRTTCCG